MSPRGVPVAEMLFTVLVRMVGWGMRSRVQARPTIIPRMMGLVMIPLATFFTAPLDSPFWLGLVMESTVTAAAL